MNSVSGSGQLLVAATPLGNVGDASTRLVDALSTADVIAAEDTRRLRALTGGLGISPAGKVVSCYDAVEAARLPGLLRALHDGSTVLLVTDAGMPLVSDPGYRLVAACVADDIPISCLPGPSAVITALAVSGLPCDRFCFEGFVPRKSGERHKWLASLVREPRATVFFESPNRIAVTMADAVDVLGGNRQAVVCRQLTKADEEIKRGSLAALAEWAADGAGGEITVVLAGSAETSPEPDISDLVARVTRRIADGQRVKEAVQEVAESAGVRKNTLYDAVLAARS